MDPYVWLKACGFYFPNVRGLLDFFEHGQCIVLCAPTKCMRSFAQFIAAAAATLGIMQVHGMFISRRLLQQAIALQNRAVMWLCFLLLS